MTADGRSRSPASGRTAKTPPPAGEREEGGPAPPEEPEESADAAAQPDATLLTDRYRLQHVLARGACGRVVAAHDVLLDRPVAVKILEALPDDVAVARALRAARAAGRVSDERVVRVLDVGGEERPFVVVPLYDARPLAETLAGGPPRRAWALALADDILRGLAAIHAAGVLHRDVGAHNVLLLSDGSARLTSTGLAAAGADPALGLRLAEADSGTEAASGLDARGDVAAAAVLLRAVLGDLVSGPVADVLTTASSQDPEERPPDAAALYRALSEAGLGEGTAPGGEAARSEDRGRAATAERRGVTGPSRKRSAAPTDRRPRGPAERRSPGSRSAGGRRAASEENPTIELPVSRGGSSGPAVRTVLLWVGLAIGAVLLLLLLRSMFGSGQGAGAAGAEGTPVLGLIEPPEPRATQSELPPIPGIDAALALRNPELPPPTLEGVLERAADDEDALDGDGEQVIERLRALDTIEEDRRPAEATELFGLAALAAVDASAWGGLALEIVTLLAPELDVDGLLALAEADPAPLDPFYQGLTEGLRDLQGLAGTQWEDAAEALQPQLETAANEGTVTPAFAAAAAALLGGPAPAASPPPPEPPPGG